MMQVRRLTRPWFPPIAFALAALLLAVPAGAQGQVADTTGAGGAPDLGALIAASAEDSDLRVVVRRFEQDRAALTRRYDVPLSPVLLERQRRFLDGWMTRLDALDPSALNAAGQEEHAELREEIAAGLVELDEREERVARIEPLLPFARPIQMLQERRRDRLDVDAQAAAQTVEDARKEVLRLTDLLAETGDAAEPGAVAPAVAERLGSGTNGVAAEPGSVTPAGAQELGSVTPAIAAEAREQLEALQRVLDSWYRYYYGFDPLFTWWVQMPYEELSEALEAYDEAIERRWPGEH